MRETWSSSQTVGFVLMAVVAAIWMIIGARGVMTGWVGRWRDGQEMTKYEAVIGGVFPLALGTMALSYLIYTLFFKR